MDAPEIAISIEAGDWPPEAELQQLAARAVRAAVRALSVEAAAFPIPPQGAELSLVFTNDSAIQELNARYRGKDKPTNVLSFPQSAGGLLGDVILAAETIRREAEVADKPLEDHMAHLIIHGFLHLMGFDHEEEADAEKMEQIERVALARLGISDPYATPVSP